MKETKVAAVLPPWCSGRVGSWAMSTDAGGGRRDKLSVRQRCTMQRWMRHEEWRCLVRGTIPCTQIIAGSWEWDMLSVCIKPTHPGRACSFIDITKAVLSGLSSSFLLLLQPLCGLFTSFSKRAAQNWMLLLCMRPQQHWGEGNNCLPSSIRLSC